MDVCTPLTLHKAIKLSNNNSVITCWWKQSRSLKHSGLSGDRLLFDIRTFSVCACVKNKLFQVWRPPLTFKFAVAAFFERCYSSSLLSDRLFQMVEQQVLQNSSSYKTTFSEVAYSHAWSPFPPWNRKGHWNTLFQLLTQNSQNCQM